VSTRIVLSGEDVLKTRFATAALLETSVALRTLQRAPGFSPYSEWLNTVLPHAEHPAIRLLLPLTRPNGMTPEWMGIPPRNTVQPGTIERELDVVRHLSVAALRDGLDEALIDPDTELRAILDRPAPGERIAEAIGDAFRLLVQPWWADIQRIVQGDIAYWTRRVAEVGLGGVLGSLSDAIRWNGQEITWGPIHNEVDVDRRGTGLVLMPVVFNSPNVGAAVRDPWETTLIFPTRSLGSLFNQRGRPEVDDHLADLLGRNRAEVLRLTARPLSTTAMAQTLKLSPATVSEHLAVLRGARLVTSYRQGKTVLYQATALGHSVVADASPPANT
jgi:DNA-binding transcriptional ArsR family regulator